MAHSEPSTNIDRVARRGSGHQIDLNTSLPPTKLPHPVAESKNYSPVNRIEHYYNRLEDAKIRVADNTSVKTTIFGPRIGDGYIEFVLPVSKDITKVHLMLYNSDGAELPFATIPFEDKDFVDRGDYKVCIKKLEGEGVGSKILYNFVVENINGNSAVILDPKSQAVAGNWEWVTPDVFPRFPTGETAKVDFLSFEELTAKDPNRVFHTVKSAAIREFPRVTDHVVIPAKEKLVYEWHAKSTAFNWAIKPENQGKLSSIVDLIPHLKSLNMTSVKFPPLHFSINEAFLSEEGGINAWGYNTAHFCGLNSRYLTAKDPEGQIKEVRAVIAALHAAGIEAIADFVVAHNCESTPGTGPAISLRPSGEDLYFQKTAEGQYVNASGCGNAINPNSEIAQDLIYDTAMFYKHQLGFDGLRIDQANILIRNEEMKFDRNHPLLNNLITLFGFAQIMVETGDMYNPNDPQDPKFHAAYGEFPSSVLEIIFAPRDENIDFFSGKPIDSFHHVLDGNPDHYGELGYINRLNFSACHDGIRPIDAAGLALENLSKLFPDMPGTKAEKRHALTRAIEASGTIFSPGPCKLSMGAEVMRTQDGNTDAWKEEHLLYYQTDPLFLYQKNHLEFMKKAFALRKEFSEFFEKVEFPKENEVSNFNEWGQKVTGTQIEEVLKHDRFHGRMYNAGGEEFADGSLYVVRAGKPGALKLPPPPENMQWVRRMDTQLKTAEQMFEKVDLYSEYIFNMPATAVFELKKMS